MENEVKPSDLNVLEDAGVAFDPTSQYLDLSKEEKRRTTALMLAISGYKELIIRDADMLREVSNQSRAGNGPAIQAATLDGIVEAAIKFDNFISGSYTQSAEVTSAGVQTKVNAENVGVEHGGGI